jgi:hypothetical protein
MSLREKIELLQQPGPTDFHFIQARLVPLVRDYRLKILTEEGARV